MPDDNPPPSKTDLAIGCFSLLAIVAIAIIAMSVCAALV